VITLKKSLFLTALNVLLIGFLVTLLLVWAQPFIFQSPSYTRNNNPVTVTGDILNSADNGVPTSGNWIKTSVPNNGPWYVMLNATFSKADASAQITWQLYEYDGSDYTIVIGSSILTTYEATPGINYIFPTVGGLQSGNPDWSGNAQFDGQYAVRASVTP
jgi:hypothetical protein